MDRRPLTRDSRLLSRILRHQPEIGGCTLDGEGWASIDAICRHTRLDRGRIEEIVAAGTRFEISPDGSRVRAFHGHSVPVDYGDPVEPPDVLYHGTTVEAWARIRESGAILPMGRVMVHLSTGAERAAEVGSRRGEPLVLRVDARRMHGDGFRFRLSGDGVYLTERVPVEYAEPMGPAHRNIPEEVMGAPRPLAHDGGQDCFEHVEATGSNPAAKAVKRTPAAR